MDAYLIHYTKLSSRLAPCLSILDSFVQNYKVISIFDKEDFNVCSRDLSLYSLKWSQRIPFIQEKLYLNMLRSRGVNSRSELFSSLKYASSTNFVADTWLNARLLKPGEISVLMKHFVAILMIATGDSNYGLIVEDDIMVDDNSKSLFLQLENLLDNHSLDYIDIAGGCNLKAADFQTSSIEGF